MGSEAFQKKILEHNLVPKHEIMKKTEAKELLTSMRIDSDQLPKILEHDPVIEAIGAKKGDIIRITRNSPTAGEAIYYRLVI